MSKKERKENIKINLETQKNAMENYLKYILEINKYQDSDDLVKEFIKEIEKMVKKFEEIDNTELSRFYRLVMMVKPALKTIISPGKVYDDIVNAMIMNFNTVLDRIRREVNDRNAIKKGIQTAIPNVNTTFELKFFCNVCQETIEIPPEMKKLIRNSDDEIKLPSHCNKEMKIKIEKNEPKTDGGEEFEEIKIYSAKELMEHSDSTKDSVEYTKILSVGIDIGTTTSHLLFSRLTLKKDYGFLNMTNRYFISNREIIYEGNIIYTPLLDNNTIDIEEVVAFCRKEYEKAEITPQMVDTGAVIVTGETAKKGNAAEIVKRLSSESGKFVSATAGPNFESVLGIMGSGILELSEKQQKTYMNIDIGGGTSNIAVASKGKILSTSCINVGGRLLGIDNDFRIWKIEEPTKLIMNELNINYSLGDKIPKEDVLKITQEYVHALFEVIKGFANSKIAKMLMMTEDLDFSVVIDGYSFSGGVAEMIYGDEIIGNSHQNPYNDIGFYIAAEIRHLIQKYELPIIEPENKIRATVIGAGSFSLSISGSTCYYDDSIELPLRNVPIVPIALNFHDLSNEDKIEEKSKKILKILKNFNLIEGEDVFALYFKDPILHSSIKYLEILGKIIEKALYRSVAHKRLILLILGGDGGKMLGLTMKKTTNIQENLFCLDELDLQTGDWIDIGKPLDNMSGEVFPITIKSLVFNN